MLKLDSKSLISYAASGTAAVGSYALLSKIEDPSLRKKLAAASAGTGVALWIGSVAYEAGIGRPAHVRPEPLLTQAFSVISTGLLVGGIGALLAPR